MHFSQFSTYNYRAPLKLILCQREHLIDELVQIDRAAGGFFRFEHRADAVDHIGGPLPGMDDLVKALPNPIKIKRRSVCPSQSRLGIFLYGGYMLVVVVGCQGGRWTNLAFPGCVVKRPPWHGLGR